MKLVKTYLEEFSSNKHDDLFIDLYGNTEGQKERYLNTLKKFNEYFGEQEVSLFSSPGRTEIGGNHTDHQGGKVLAAAINLDGLGVATPKANTITIKSDDYPIFNVDLNDLSLVQAEQGTSIGLVRGMCAGFKERGYNIGGFDLYMTSNVLSGSGLSSSAMFEALIGSVLNAFYNENKVDPITLAQISQYAENVYFGKPCGLMDQMAICVGGFVYIDFKDEAKPIVEKVDFDFNTTSYNLCIVDTKSSHDDLTDEYAAIPLEMKKIATHFKKEKLSEVNEADFYHNLMTLRSLYGDRAVLRAMHYFSECHVVDEEKEALANHNIEGFLKGVSKSGNSSFKYLQNIYANANYNAQGVSFALALSEHLIKEHGVCRVHGGGFAGTMEAFVDKETLATYEEEMNKVLGAGSVQVLKIRSKGATQIL